MYNNTFESLELKTEPNSNLQVTHIQDDNTVALESKTNDQPETVYGASHDTDDFVLSKAERSMLQQTIQNNKNHINFESISQAFKKLLQVYEHRSISNQIINDQKIILSNHQKKIEQQKQALHDKQTNLTQKNKRYMIKKLILLTKNKRCMINKLILLKKKKRFVSNKLSLSTRKRS